MRTLARTLIAVPAAAAFVALYAATSPPIDWQTVAAAEIAAEILLDAEGEQAGTVTVEIAGLTDLVSLADQNLVVRVIGEDVRRSLDVRDARDEDVLQQVRDTPTFWLDVFECDEDPCTLERDLVFEGRPDSADTVTFEAAYQVPEWDVEQIAGEDGEIPLEITITWTPAE